MKRKTQKAGGENGLQVFQSLFIVPESSNILNLCMLRIFLVKVTTERVSRDCNAKLNKGERMK